MTKAVILNCIAHSSDKSEKLECKVIRDETRVNTFNVRVKRTDQNMDDRADDNACNSPKRFKVSADQPTKVALAGNASKYNYIIFLLLLLISLVRFIIFFVLWNQSVVNITGTTKPKSKEGKKGKKGKSSRAIVLRKPGPKSLEFVEVNQVLLCKMRGYPEWPCMVTDIENKFIHITFFGDKTTHKTTIGHLFDFKLNHLTVRKHLRRLTTPLYRKSVLEAELSLGVPKEHSILNEI